MSPTASKIIGEAKGDYEERTYTISARPEHLDKLETLFSWINMTRGGHSGTAQLSIDGDGAARVEVTKKDGDLPKHDSEARCDGKVEFSVGLD